ncbi:gamma-glutamylcyclotransferase [Devosia sp. ZB163]|uniref:gamma-glutamylcyclotransferase family protein n=1 Tax=Devosia sp. ZB163 TaxID=3025938 RepID=UPI0023606631|nr:gamma-glutamylcyclotransferase family protein [Devosia sp. ZB163]MDC9822100.1 gamma-glutamylcyclotransferase [Devosia sp. ZB163]
MHLPLFVYGTLRDPDLLAGILDRPLRGEKVHVARAPGFRAVHYPGRIYPALIRVPGAAAEGLLLTDLTPFERDLLDAFEGEEYRRGTVAAMVEEELFEADAYLPVITVADTGEDWSLARWQAEHKPRVLDAEAATAADLRLRLIAIRPH